MKTNMTNNNEGYVIEYNGNRVATRKTMDGVVKYIIDNKMVNDGRNILHVWSNETGEIIYDGCLDLGSKDFNKQAVIVRHKITSWMLG